MKKLSDTHLHETEFQREVECLMSVKHKNIVRFLGYCADTQGSVLMHNKRHVLADVQSRLLCFEYVPNGSLCDHISSKIKISITKLSSFRSNSPQILLKLLSSYMYYVPFED